MIASAPTQCLHIPTTFPCPNSMLWGGELCFASNVQTVEHLINYSGVPNNNKHHVHCTSTIGSIYNPKILHCIHILTTLLLDATGICCKKQTINRDFLVHIFITLLVEIYYPKINNAKVKVPIGEPQIIMNDTSITWHASFFTWSPSSAKRAPSWRTPATFENEYSGVVPLLFNSSPLGGQILCKQRP